MPLYQTKWLTLAAISSVFMCSVAVDASNAIDHVPRKITGKAFLKAQRNAPANIIPRGGASVATESEAKEALKKYRLQQQHLLQLRSTFLSEALAARGIKVGPTLVDVATPEGSKPPQETDWDCCMSTVENPKSCLYSFDAEPNTKVISPIGTDQYISLSALNRLRRTDPTKVEPMWHSQYAVLKSWFSDASQYSLLQFVGWKGFIVSTLLLDLGKGLFLRGLLAMSVFSTIMLLMPFLEIVVSRFMTSSILWMKWMSWGKFVHAALPLKILIGQMTWKFLAGSFGKLEGVVRDYIVDLECAILEENIPVTIRDEEDVKEEEDVSDDISDAIISDDDLDETDASSDEYDFSDDEY